ncbi:geraniol 8-hydroxylase-like [Papaver somniferum]|uniref:geraniol 8-hydroxylase-like n=1 Tax=Papaver somniferum TaxID=3469 RepID=UPI000E6FD88C|nr:geraniol 8-hydroxylase-like [Papaver somniferum]
MAELLHNPSKITNAQQELSDILREPTNGGIRYRSTTLLQAIVKETLRLHPPIPFLVPHKAESNVEIHDVIVPKGRRICPGLPLAHRMVHLILGLLLQSFYWKLEDGLKPEDLDMEEEFGFTLAKATGLRAIPVIRL